MSKATYDFSGWATRNDLRCSDGRTIRKDAFKHNDGQTVPLVWNHQHNDPMNVLGHALLENRDEGVYAYCSLNDTAAGENAKKFVQHGDVVALSIYANQLQQRGADVLHGAIREVSLVLAGANPGAFIDAVLEHGEESEDSAIIYTGEPLSLTHADAEEDTEEADDGEETVADVFNTLSEKQKTVVYALIGQAIEDAKGGKVEHSELAHAEEESDGEETVADVFNTLSEKQKTVVYALIGQALEDAKSGKNTDDETDEESEGGNMKHNVFDTEETYDENVLSHSEMTAIIEDGKRFGSLKESALQHGIEEISTLFPDDHATGGAPKFLNDYEGTWIAEVMNGVHKTPFSRLKSIWADISDDDARAKGFLADHTHRDSKGNLVDDEGNPVMKKDEVFSLLKRTTAPTTVYKKQKLDRDDVIDITDFDVVSWIKQEMRAKLDEEIAHAILVGDGRLASSDDKINETNIRPIWTDSSLYTINQTITVASDDTDDDKAAAIIDNAVLGRIKYKGAGNPVMFTTETWLAKMLLLKDLNGRRIYATENELATAMRVKKIVTCPYMDNLSRTVTTALGGSEERELAALIVNLTDYTVGADKGGAVNLFDDFDIDYNAQKYLIETRCSGSLMTPYSAIALEFVDET